MNSDHEQVLAAMTQYEVEAAVRLCQLCDDNEGYDIDRSMMKRLEAYGLVVDKKFGRFYQTDLLIQMRPTLEGLMKNES